MTEAEWLNSPAPDGMLAFLRGRAGDRKLRLFACACCRRVWDRMADERTRSMLLTAERFADDTATADELQRALDEARAADDDVYANGGDQYTSTAVLGLQARVDTALVTANVVSTVTFTGDAELNDAAGDEARFEELVARRKADVRRSHALLLKDIFGNPFRPATAVSSFLTSTVVALAFGIYRDRAFDRLPILADALQDAGCDDPDILDHCRSAGPHVRGCWVTDLLLGKE